ncbi:hypothetical protein Tco_1280162 [Tanacetum coccineum]
MYKGIEVGKDKVYMSHLQFADDALFFGEWSLHNAKVLSRMLSCFHLASGLKVNLNKSKLFGVGASSLDLNFIANTIGFQPASLHLLGSPNWSQHVKAPISIINKLETIRRRFLWGGNIEENKIAWIAWDKIMSPLIQGGLGVGSLRTCNQAMLCKW